MSFPAYLLLFFIGSALGSFLNVIVDRLPRGENFLTGRSHCEHCRHKLAWYDLIPLLSFISLNGQCRYCKKQLSLYYPVIEIVAGLSFAALFVSVFGQDIFVKIFDVRLLLAGIYLLVLLYSLVAIFFIDLKYGIIPFTIVFLLFLFSLLWFLFSPSLRILPQEIPYLIYDGSILNYLLSAAGAFGFFLFLFLITRGRGLGFGDVVYVFLMGFLLGFPKIVLGLYIAFLSGAFISFLLVLFGKKKFSGGTIAFGPFLVSGTIISFFWGDVLIDKIMMFLLSR